MKNSLLLILTFICSISFAQQKDWVQMMQDPNANFDETVKAFEDYWNGREVTRGSGWKPFKRWQWYMEQRVGPDRKQDGPLKVIDEMNKYWATHPKSQEKRNSTTGSWVELGPTVLPANGTGQPNGMGRVNCITFHPTDMNTFWVGAPAGGIWKTTDYGVTFTDLTNNLTSTLGVSAIVVDPGNPNLMYIGTGDRDGGDAPGRGVYRSTDGGLTWAVHNTGMGNRTVNKILMDPGNSSIMIAFTNNRIYRTTNGGTNWTQTFSGHNCYDAVFKPNNSNIVYATGSRFYRSTDNGQSWTQITSGLPTTGVRRMAVTTTAADGNYVYVLIANSGNSFHSFRRSTDNGLNFTTMTSTPNILGYDTNGGSGGQGWYDLTTVADPANRDVVYTGGINCWKTTDGGTNFAIQTHWYGAGGNPSVHADHHYLAFSPVTGDLWLCGDGGIHFTTDAGNSWTERSSGLPIAQIYKIGQGQQTRDMVINGYQDNGTAFYREGSWYTEIGGDGMECIVDYSDNSVMYGALYFGDIRRSTNNGASFSVIADNGTNGITESGSWVTPYKLHPINPDTMFIGYRDIWRAFNAKSAATNAVTWVEISNFGGTSTIRDLAISRSNPDVMYVARNNSSGRFWKTTNANAASPTWTSLHGNLPVNSTPKDIEINPTNPDNLWIAINNDIYESTDGGLTWTNYAGTLPNISLNTIVYDRGAPNDPLYIGNDAGVWYRDNTMTDWTNFSTNLPPVEVTELEIYYDSDCRGNDILRAATYGRGLWESDLIDPGNIPPDACFFADPTTTCVGATITLEDFSAYGPTSWNWTISPGTFSFAGTTSGSSQNPQVIFTAPGTYSITLTATNGNGSDVVTRTNYITIAGTAVVPPITEDFETHANCATTSNCGTTICNLINGWTNWTNGSEDNIDWRIDNGGTPSSGTGPSVDASPGTAAGNYAYTEASSCYGQTAIMESPCLDFTSIPFPEIRFAFHMQGTAMGELHVDILAGSGWTNDVTTPITGNQGTNWQYRTIDLTAYTGMVVKLRLRAITGTSFTSDIAVDDILIRNNPALDIPGLTFNGAFVPGQGNVLQWQTQNLDPQRFNLEKKMADGNYAVLETVEAAAGKENYRYADQNVAPGWNYYRLQMMDQNGRTDYSEVVEILNTFDQEQVLIFPNPATQSLNVEIIAGETKPASLKVMDLMGKTLLIQPVSVKTGLNRFQLNLSELEAGVYMVRYKNQSIKFVKQ